MKKYLACILALVLMLALCACGGDSEPNGTEGTPTQSTGVSGGLEFESNGDGTCTLVGIGTYTEEELVISGTSPEGDAITAIGEEAFAGCGTLKTLTISSAELTVQPGAFYRCGNLTEVIIKNSTLTLEESVFEESGIETVQIDGSDVTAGDGVFCYTESLARFRVKDSTLKTDASFNSSGIQELVFTDSDVIIGEGAFFDCYDLTSIIAEGGSVEIGGQAFYECTGLTNVTLKCEVSIGEDAFKYCKNLTSVEFGDDHIILGELSFGYCEQLTTVTIGNADVDFGEDVFYGCPEDLIIYLDGKKFNGAFEEIISEEEKKQAYIDLQNNLSSEKVAAVNAFFHDDLTDGQMALSSDIQNNTDGVIQDLIVVFAAWDADGSPVMVKGASSQSTWAYLQKVNFSGIIIGAGETWKAEGESDAVTGDTVITGYMIDPSLTNIYYVKTIVVSCTLEDGTTWENPYYGEWVDTFGGVVLESWMME